MTRKDKRFFEEEEEGKMRIDEMTNNMKTFRIRKINPNPGGNHMTTRGFPATTKQKERLNKLVDDLYERGVDVSLPKEPEHLKKGEAWNIISKLIGKQRQVEKAFAV